MKYNEMYNRAFINNAASILLYKSGRKNAKCSDIISMNHLINHNDNRKISDERIMQQFVDVFEKIVFQSMEYNKHLEVSVFLDTGKNSSYENANTEIYKTTEHLRFNWNRYKFSSIEQVINFLYSVFCLIYPYNEINLENGIYNNSSVKHCIKKYYGGVNQ